MAQKIRKCPVCKKEGLEVELVPYPEKYKSRLLHKECRESLVQKDLAEKEERLKREHFWETFTKMLDIETKDIPNNIYEYGMNLRNGNSNNRGCSKYVDKRYRDGFEWDIIEMTLVESKDNIRYALDTKNFKSVTSLFRYLFAIISDKVVLINKREQYKKQELERIQKTTIDDEQMRAYEEEEQPKRKRKKQKTDISRFLDDEEE